MNFSFDYFNQYEIPSICLSNPDGTQLYMLGTIYDRAFKMRFNALSEFTFTADKMTDGIINDYYDSLDYRRIVNVTGIGNFMITQVEEINDGIIQEKKIICQSLECELSFKKLSLFRTNVVINGEDVLGSIQFWDGTKKSLMGKIMKYVPGWSISHIDTEIALLYRTFDVTDITIYSFLMNDVSQTFQCVFTFDSVLKTIRVNSVANATHNTDMFFSYQNLVEQVNIKEITEELVTALNVFGGGTLDISVVNPLGNNTIYNFNYYKNPQWMSGSLITAITNWENKVSACQVPYANSLALSTIYNTNLVSACAVGVTLQGELDAITEVLTVQIQQGNIDLAPQNALVKAKQNEVDTQVLVVAGIQSQLNAENESRKLLNQSVSFDNNFTEDSQKELSNFIIGSTYTNSNWIFTDGSSASYVQSQAQGLYDQAKLVLAKIAEPRYTFDVTAANFVFLKEYQTFINILNLGSVVTVEFDSGIYAYPVLLGIDYDYDNPTNFKLIFSNRLRLDDAAFQFSDLFAQSVSNGITTSFNSEMWSSWQNNYKDSVSTFITSALDASKNAVLGAKNQQFVLDGNGLRGRYLDPNTNQFSDKQLWMINNMLVFTDTNWNTAKLALGEILVGQFKGNYGLIADVISNKVIRITKKLCL